jgi:signal transduction histidine kinase
MPIVLFSAAAYASRSFARLALVIAILAYVGVWAIEVNLLGRLDSLPSPVDALATPRGAAFVVFAVLVLIWAVGEQVRAARERLERDLERAGQLAREQEASARIGTLAERHRIARELHDVVAHGLSVMIVQADGALYAEAMHPEAPRQALATIASTGRESLHEMRRLLGVLRDDPSAAVLAPQPGLASLPILIGRFRGSGLDVSYTQEGTIRQMPPAVGLTAYRVVQESLTNVLQHAGPTLVDVRIVFNPEVLEVVVANQPGSTPPRPAAGSTGLGLLGMRERVSLLDGRMTAGPTPPGGFRVQVEIPIKWASVDPARRGGQDEWRPQPTSGPDASEWSA